MICISVILVTTVVKTILILHNFYTVIILSKCNMNALRFSTRQVSEIYISPALKTPELIIINIVSCQSVALCSCFLTRICWNEHTRQSNYVLVYKFRRLQEAWKVQFNIFWKCCVEVIEAKTMFDRYPIVWWVHLVYAVKEWGKENVGREILRF